jgi:hypothetical protein
MFHSPLSFLSSSVGAMKEGDLDSFEPPPPLVPLSSGVLDEPLPPTMVDSRGFQASQPTLPALM